MAPQLAQLFTRNSAFDPSSASRELKTQLVNPSDVFSVLLILGGEVIARALAQLAGSGLAPVSFSFGWVAYSISALVSAFGENKLMPPEPDCKCRLIHGKSGYARDNTSWILGRLVRDYDYWMHPDVKSKLNDVLGTAPVQGKDESRRAGLVISVYQPSPSVPAGHVSRDLVYWTGVPVILLQLGIAAIPCGVYGDWGVLLVTVAGTCLSILTGLLPQWKKEKWACRHNSQHSFILTRGNGAQHAIIILGNAHGLDLEDLAVGQSNAHVATNRVTRAALFMLSILWIFVLLCAAGLKENSWFLLAVGGIGIAQNVFVAGSPRRPENCGIPLEFVRVFGHRKVMKALEELENDQDDRFWGLGCALVSEYFPGDLRPVEHQQWENFRARVLELNAQKIRRHNQRSMDS